MYVYVTYLQHVYRTGISTKSPSLGTYIPS